MASDVDKDECYILTEEQEEAVEMIRQAIYEAGDTGLPEEVALLLVMQMAAEIAVQIGVSRGEFLEGATHIYTATAEEDLIERASNLTPVDE